MATTKNNYPTYRKELGMKEIDIKRKEANHKKILSGLGSGDKAVAAGYQENE